MTHTPVPLSEELTLPILLQTARQLVIDFCNANPHAIDVGLQNMRIQREVRRLFNEEGGERAYDFLKIGAMIFIRTNGLGTSVYDLQKTYELS